ncbi:MAG TPA: tonB-system energizer ExbB [Rhizobium sp.]
MSSACLPNQSAATIRRPVRLIGLTAAAGLASLWLVGTAQAQERAVDTGNTATMTQSLEQRTGADSNTSADQSGKATPSLDPAAENISTSDDREAITPTTDVESRDTQSGGSAIVPEASHQTKGQTDAVPNANAATNQAETGSEPVAPSGTPTLLDDPAGALKQIFATPERRSDLPHDLSAWGMFMNADVVVKGVMTGLAFASLVTWTIWLAKMIELVGARTRVGKALKIIRSSRSLDEAARQMEGRDGPAAIMLRAAKEEADISASALDHAGGVGLKERVSSALGRIEAFAGRRVSKGTGLLATIGSTAPFVGLFGTVWGIMNAFIGISEAQTTNLAVVAPGIAEALLATAIGLVAAIPAVIIYNVFARSITGYRQLLSDAAAGVERLVSRDLDFRKVPGVRNVHSQSGSLHAVAGSRVPE